MRKLVLLVILCLIAASSMAQRTIDFEQDVFFTQSIDPSIEYGKSYARGTFSVDKYQFGANIDLDKFNVGVYSQQELGGSEYNAYLSSRSGRFTGTLFVGYYEFDGRNATTGGFSLAYGHENGYIGFKMRDLFDVPYNDAGDTDTFFRYEGVTPEIFVRQSVFNKDDLDLRLHGSVSYNPVEAYSFNAVAELQILSITLGWGWATDELVGYIKKDWGNVAMFASGGEEVNVGVNFRLWKK